MYMEKSYGTDNDNWQLFLNKVHGKRFKIYFEDDSLVIAKYSSLFGSSFQFEAPADDTPGQHMIVDVVNRDTFRPHAFLCRLTNEVWEGYYMARDGRDGEQGSFGYNDSGGEFFKVEFVTDHIQLTENDDGNFKVKLYVIGQGQQLGTTFGVYSDNQQLTWGKEHYSQICRFECIEW